MSLSTNLTLAEATVTQTGIDNTPSIDHESRLIWSAQYLFQPTRDRWGPIRITSGYRSPAVNQAVFGSKTSQHCRGEALDMIPMDAEIKAVYLWIIDNLKFGQAILETVGDNGWIHLSLPRINADNQSCLTFDGNSYSVFRRDKP